MADYVLNHYDNNSKVYLLICVRPSYFVLQIPLPFCALMPYYLMTGKALFKDAFDALTHVLVVIADVDPATGQLIGAGKRVGPLHLATPVHLVMATASGGRQHRALAGGLLDVGRGYCAIASVLLLLCISLVFSWFCKNT